MTFKVDQLKSAVSQGLAMTNLFRVLLPPIDAVSGPYQLNVLCKTASMPGRQILTNERQYGAKRQKIAYGHATEDVNLTFHLLNNYGAKEYFENWMNQVFDFERGEAYFKKEYEKDIAIQQLKKDVIFDLSFQVSDPFGLGLEITGDVVTPDQIAYTCKLLNAFPTTMNAIEFSNEPGQIGEISVSLSYTDWEADYGFSVDRALDDVIPGV